MKTRWLIYILLGVFLSSCYKEENIEGEEDEPKYKVEDSEDPLDHFIYGFYHDYGVFILYDYEEVDYRWNMSTVLDVELIKQTDKLSPEKLIDVIEETMAGEHIFPDKTPSVKLGLADSSELTAKEIEVLRLVCEGLEYSEIAERMHISQRTVKFHISNILSKTGYANKTRLAIAVTNKNFIIPSSPEKNPSSW